MTLPEFKVTIGDYDTRITLNGRNVAAAWGPAADGTGEWFSCLYGEDPIRQPDEKTAREHCVSILARPLPEWAKNGPVPVDECCDHHGNICDLMEDQGCCDRCPRWAKS